MSTRKGASTSTGRRNTSQNRPAKTIDLKAEETKPQAAKTGAAKPAAPAKQTVPKTGAAAKAAEKPSTVKKEPPKSDAKAESKADPKADARKPSPSGNPTDQKPADTTRITQPSQAASTSRSGVVSLLAASIVGGIISLGIVGGLNGAGVLGVIPGLSGLLGASAPEQPTVEIGALQAELDELRANQNTFASQLESAAGAAADGGGLNALIARSDAMEVAIAANAQKIEALTQASSNSSASGDAVPDAETSSRLTAMGERLTGTEAEIAALREDLEQGTSADTLTQSITALESHLDEEVAGLASTVSALQSADADIQALSEKVTRIETALAELQEARAERSSSEDRIARSVAANALRTGYERGEPFAGLLASVQALTGPLDAASALEQQAANGVKTAQQLAAEFGALAGDIVQQSQPPADGVVSQLLSNARALVRVRPSGPIDGNSPEAIVSRIEDRLENADLAAALEQWNALPDAAKALSQGWASALEERIAADRSMADILNALMPQATQPEGEQSGGGQSG